MPLQLCSLFEQETLLSNPMYVLVRVSILVKYQRELFMFKLVAVLIASNNIFIICFFSSS